MPFPAPKTSASTAEYGARARVGTTVDGQWRIDALIATGGSSAIYAVTRSNGQSAAMKILHDDLADNSTAVQHFLQEGRAVNGVAHPGVVAVIDEGSTADGAPYLVMPLLEGETAQQRLDRHPQGLPPREALSIAAAVLDVLVAAHARGVVHRDLKPDNVFLERTGAVRVLDFGIARIGSCIDLTLYGTVLGTAGYLPPEQAGGRLHEVGPRSDLWAVGALLYTLLSGRVLHDEPNLIASILRAQTEPVPPANDLLPGLPDSVAQVLDGALAFDVGRRWMDATAMRLAVHVARDELGLQDSTGSCPGLSVEALATRSARTMPSDAPVAADVAVGARGSRAPVGWLAAACIAAVWAIVAIFMHSRPAPMSAVAAAPPPRMDMPCTMLPGEPSLAAPSGTAEVAVDELPMATVAGSAAPSTPAVASTKAAPTAPAHRKPREIVRTIDF